MIRCPSCGVPAFLVEFAISLVGAVEPEFRCPRPGCGFHDVLVLDGWKPPIASKSNPS